MAPQVEASVPEKESEEDPQQQQLQYDQHHVLELKSALEGMRLQMSDAENQMQKLAELVEKAKQERRVMELSQSVEELRRQMSNMQKTTHQQLSNMHKEIRQQAARHHLEKSQWQAERQFIMAQLKKLQTVQTTSTIPKDSIENQPKKPEQTPNPQLGSQQRIAAPVPDWLHQKIMQERQRKPRRVIATPIPNSFAICQKSLRDCNDPKCGIHAWVLKTNSSAPERTNKSQENVGQTIIPNRNLLLRYNSNVNPNLNLSQAPHMGSENSDATSKVVIQELACGDQNVVTSNVTSSADGEKTSQNQLQNDITTPIINLNRTSNGSEIERYKEAIRQAGINMQEELRMCKTKEEKMQIMANYEKAMNKNIAALGELAIRGEK